MVKREIFENNIFFAIDYFVSFSVFLIFDYDTDDLYCVQLGSRYLISRYITVFAVKGLFTKTTKLNTLENTLHSRGDYSQMLVS